MSGQGHEEQYAQRLRERYADAAPLIDIDPDVVIRRGRNRRFARWGGCLAAVAVIAVAAGALLPGLGGRGSLFDAGPPASSTPPPEPADAEASLWVSAPRVPPGADLAVATSATAVPTCTAGSGRRSSESPRRVRRLGLVRQAASAWRRW